MASDRNRRATSGSFSSALRTLMATSRCRVSSMARYTVPMPPRPTRSSTRYLPMSCPTMRNVAPVRARELGSLGRTPGLVNLRRRPDVSRSAVDRVQIDRAGPPAKHAGADESNGNLIAEPGPRRAGHEDVAGTGQFLHARRRVDHIAEHGELAPPRRPDVAGQRHTAVDGNAHPELRCIEHEVHLRQRP